MLCATKYYSSKLRIHSAHCLNAWKQEKVNYTTRLVLDSPEGGHHLIVAHCFLNAQFSDLLTQNGVTNALACAHGTMHLH